MQEMSKVKKEIERGILYWTPFLIILLIIAISYPEYRLEILVGALVGVIAWTLIRLWSNFVSRIAK